MRALIALFALLTLLAVVPHASAMSVDPVGAVENLGPVKCLLAPYFPETPVYYIVWGCTAGAVAPEPIDYATGCRIGGPVTALHCDLGDGAVTGPVVDCLRDCFILIPPCGVQAC